MHRTGRGCGWLLAMQDGHLVTRPAGDDRSGVALIVSVLLLLALLALAQGALTLARLELEASLADRGLLQARAAAETGIRRAFYGSRAAPLAPVGLWGRVPVGSGALGAATFSADLTRLSREAWLLTGEGRVKGHPGVVRLGRAVWILDPLGRVADASGVLEVGSDTTTSLGGSVDGTAVTAEAPPLVAGVCSRWYAALDSLLPSGRLPDVGELVADTLLPEPRLGRLDAIRLLARIPGRVSGVGTPAPVEDLGGCDSAAVWNWGSPREPGGPCATYFVTRAAEGALTLRGGEGQGILVVLGDLTLTDSVSFYGLLLVGGRLRLGSGARVTGLVRARGGAETEAGTEIVGSACWVLSALEPATEQLTRPVPLGGAERIGPLGPDW